MNNILIVGSTSGIAREIAKQFAAHGYSLALAGRDVEAVRQQAAELATEYGTYAVAYPFEALQFDRHQSLIDQVRTDCGELEGLILCHGYLGDQHEAQQSMDESRRIFEINFLSCVSLLNIVSTYLEARGHGFICALSSVAGDRGKRSNYIYGAAKGALTVYLQGLRHRLRPSGIHVVTVKPGFVDTRMTQGMASIIPAAKPERVAKGIYWAIVKHKNTVYLPGYWRWIMGVLRCVPDFIFQKLSI